VEGVPELATLVGGQPKTPIVLSIVYDMEKYVNRGSTVHDSSKEAAELAKKGPKFPSGPKLGGFTVRKITNAFGNTATYHCPSQV
jgi:hypothetical protein